MYCSESYSQSNVIVATYPGRGTGDTVYQTATGDTFEIRASCGHLPSGYRWADQIYHTNVYDSPIKADVLGPPPKPRYIPMVDKRKTIHRKLSVRAPKFVRRPEFHARSNPR